MGKICLKCGSLNYSEYHSGAKITYEPNKKKRIDESLTDVYGDVVEIECENCGNENSANFLWLDIHLEKLLVAKNRKERLKFLLRKVIEGYKKTTINEGQKETLIKSCKKFNLIDDEMKKKIVIKYLEKWK